jgi:hypothetical protein
LYRYVFNSPVNFRDPSGELPPIVIVVFIGAAVGAAFFGTPNVANAPGPNDPVLAGPVIDPEAAVSGTFVGAAYGLGVWCVREEISFVETRISPSGGIITGEGMTKQAVLRAFLRGERIAKTEANIAALRWYLEVGQRTLARYQEIGYTGIGVAVQRQRIQMILQQLAEWGIAP